ncbi:MAG: CRISPR-associated endonuclease Cas1 [Roseiarcus sp.]
MTPVIQGRAEMIDTMPGRPPIVAGRAIRQTNSGWAPIKWRGTGRRPIPDDWHSIRMRSSPCLSGNRNAAHPVDAILNYAYAALESEIQIKAISDRYDPTIGIMHEGSDGSTKFIFDLMEPERPKIDRAVVGFVEGHVFDPADFVMRPTAFADLGRVDEFDQA